jgi:hypothetical protein
MSGDIMIKNARVVAISLDAISPKPGPYGMSFGFDLGSLMRSIEEVGILNPPLIRANQSGGWDVVSGFRRTAAARALGWEELMCRDLSPLSLSSLECLILNLQDNLPTRTFNEVEKGMILKRLSRHESAEKLQRHYMPLLGLPCHEPTLRFYLLIDGIEEPLKHDLAEGRISPRSLTALLDLDPGSRKAVGACIRDLRLNFNYQSQFIEYLIEISGIENTTPGKIVAGNSIAGILGDEKLNPPQKARVLMDSLRSRRNPRLATWERIFRSAVSKLMLPPGVRISHPPGFESPFFAMEVSFRDGGALREKLVRLSRTEGLENIRSPMGEGS